MKTDRFPTIDPRLYPDRTFKHGLKAGWLTIVERALTLRACAACKPTQMGYRVTPEALIRASSGSYGMANFKTHEIFASALASLVVFTISAKAQESVVGNWRQSASGSVITISLGEDGTYERDAVVVTNLFSLSTTVKGQYQVSGGVMTFHPTSNIRTTKDGQKIDLGVNPEQKQTLGIAPVKVYFRGPLLCLNGDHETCFSRQP